MPRRSLVIPVATMALLVAGCSSPHDPKTDPPPTRSAPSMTASSTAATTAGAGPAATPTPGTVPVDQIPPGRPASWIPAGMPTVAPWKEPGDVLPRFRLAMFRDDAVGAASVATYFVDARNWALATLDPASYLLVCDAASCQDNARRQLALRKLGQHVVGGRGDLEEVGQSRAPATAEESQIVRITVSLHSGRTVDASGMVVRSEAAAIRMLDLALRWNGRMWRITDVSLVTS